MLRDTTTVAFRCDACGPGPSAAYDLGNPSFAEVVGDLVRPSAILHRTGAWSSRYFHRGAGAAACTRCAHAIRLEVHADTSRCGLRGRCRACGEEVWSSAQGLVHGLPEARAFRHDHGRLRTLPARGLGYHGADALLVRLESLRGSASLDVVLRRDTLRVLAAH
jgi:hypothetical protein